ncbi:MAG: hypothetical protein AABW68_00645 [archaeon]
MNLTYRCKHLELGNGLTIKEPLIPVTLKGSNGIRLNVTAVLDSGSDFVLLPLEIADALELKYNVNDKDTAKLYTGTTITTTQSSVRIQLSKGHENMEIECDCAIFLEKEKQHEHIIFGSSFFDHFRIHFDYPHNRFSIKQ